MLAVWKETVGVLNHIEHSQRVENGVEAHSHTALPHRTPTLHSHTALPHGTPTLHSHDALPHCTPTMHSHTAPTAGMYMLYDSGLLPHSVGQAAVEHVRDFESLRASIARRLEGGYAEEVLSAGESIRRLPSIAWHLMLFARSEWTWPLHHSIDSQQRRAKIRCGDHHHHHPFGE